MGGIFLAQNRAKGWPGCWNEEYVLFISVPHVPSTVAGI